jgi:hypothetical protein
LLALFGAHHILHVNRKKVKVQIVNKSDVWNLNNKNGASLLSAALLLMSSVLTLQAVCCHINFTLRYPLNRFGPPQTFWIV